MANHKTSIEYAREQAIRSIEIYRESYHEAYQIHQFITVII